ncbi:hypothetical protein [Microbacterium terregens]|uniref:DUF1467 family protein n=1 Tax=Microbacterium terregens TaxID=69363 RepID=A0ABV5T2I2_9MICO
MTTALMWAIAAWLLALFIMFLTGPVPAAFARLLLHKSVRSEQDRRKR